ncbi:DMT family transporter [Fluviicola chungangensis]|uniref:DMT family transporter n=1 Tax=Fluviicola chungangensis TaxID=2597671 RepID=A0A556MPR9_9FLAO|nr:DMT family transporter [Fluviicola chungangensis]TSJ41920.1 DMT family transporter [Fluviicola chungangensis]
MIKGISYIILSGMAFFIINFFVKLLGNPDNEIIPHLQKYPAHELVFFRSLVSFAISAAIIKYRGLPLLGNNRRWLLLRGTAGMLALTIFFFTLHKLPLAIASTLQYLSPIFTVLIASRLFRERVSNIQYFSSLIAFSGVVFIGFNGITGGFNSQKTDLFWMGMGILSAVLSGVAYNAISKLKETEETINIVIYFPMLALPLTGIWCLFDFTVPRGVEWLILLIIGVFTQIAQVCMTRAFLSANTAIIAPFQYIGAIYALISGWFVFNEKLETASIIGVCLVVFGVIFGTIFRAGKKLRKDPELALEPETEVLS